MIAQNPDGARAATPSNDRGRDMLVTVRLQDLAEHKGTIPSQRKATPAYDLVKRRFG
jgi:hypothetical protein